MYAIIEDGNRQLTVELEKELEIDYRDLAPGEQVVFDRVLAYRDEQGLKLGRPTLPGASVTAEVVSLALGEKLVIQKFRRRKGYRRKTGHRQLFTRVRIKSISPA